jgi:DNA topoisomerase-1
LNDTENGQNEKKMAKSGNKLVIVESPAKAKTIGKYLGDDFVVMASVGHIRDLPGSATEMPIEYKGESWASLAINVDHEFEGIYVADPNKKKLISELKAALKEADELYLATDEDREGEAISWHLLELLQPKVPVHRMVFHEITSKAIANAVENPRDLDMNLVEAQETRRKVDRLFGYEVSEVLWRKVKPRISAGRVQSAALRLIVDRERERIAFIKGSYADILAQMTLGFKAELHSVNDVRIADGKSFDENGKLVAKNVVLITLSEAERLVSAIDKEKFTVAKIEQKQQNRKPFAPFTTSTLQQEAGKKFRWSSKRTMDLAQDLYARGFITYMRTDSPTLSEQATTAARKQATELYGANNVADAPRLYGASAKGAQEAHEAIRPAGENFATPDMLRAELNADSFRLYDLIWRRTLASQMADSREATTTATLETTAGSGEKLSFRASGTVVLFAGWRAAYDIVEEDEDDENSEKRLPALTEGQVLSADELKAVGHETKPPARFTEPSLVKKMEEIGIGRPSTYAATIATLLDRGYISKPKGPALVPSWLAMNVIKLLETHYMHLVDYAFTANMELKLDQVAEGNLSQLKILKDFYWGGGEDFEGLKPLLKNWADEIDAREMASISIPNADAVVRVGKYGAFLERGETTANLPEDVLPDELTPEKVQELFDAPSGDRELGVHPETGYPIVAKVGRFGPYVTEVLPEGTKTKGKGAIKPKTASLLKTMAWDTVTMEDALMLMSLPRTVGVDSEGRTITAQNGPFGPYLLREKDSRSLPDEESMFTITVEGALELYAQPKTRGRGVAKEPLASYGNDPVTNQLITLREGRFGLYVTDGETNASLRVGDNAQNLTPERAVELLSDRRERGPVEKKKRPRKAAKTAATKTAKKTTKKSAK